MFYKFTKEQSGQVLTELALVSPLIMVALIAIVSLGQAAQKQALVARAASAAARTAVVRPDLAPSVAAKVLRTADPSISSGDIRTTVERVAKPGLPLSGFVRVIVVYEYRPISGFGWRPKFSLRAEFVADQYTNAAWLDLPREDP